MPFRYEGGRRVPIDSWEGHVERMIREARERGEFDNLPGAGKPLDLEENPHAGEWQSAFRMARNAGAAPLWVTLEGEIAAGQAALRELAQRTAVYLRLERERLARRGGASREGPRDRWWRRLLFGTRGAGTAPQGPRTVADLEAERARARRRYLQQAAAVDARIRDFNSHRPRQLTWLEKPRLLPERAGQDFDALCPPLA